jgi:hypothetical protein
MMVYRTVKDALDTLLVAKAAGKYSVLTAKNRGHDVRDIFTIPRVLTYYDSGTFDKSKSSLSAPFDHLAILKIEMLVASKATADLSVLNDSGSTAEQLAAALAARDYANIAADDKLDALSAQVFDIIMSPENSDFGMGWEPNRFITGFDKTDPAPRGSLFFLSGIFTMTIEVPETVTGETGTAADTMDNIIKVTSDVTGSTLDSAKQGVEVINE